MTKKIYTILFIILFAAVFSFLVYEGYIKFSWEKGLTFGKYSCPYFITSGSHHGDIHMPEGTIFGYETKGGEKLYDIIRDDTFIYSAYFIEDFFKIKCFGTEKGAVALGYEKFLSDQAARLKQRLEAPEWSGQITGRITEYYTQNPATNTAKYGL